MIPIQNSVDDWLNTDIYIIIINSLEYDVMRLDNFSKHIKQKQQKQLEQQENWFHPKPYSYQSQCLKYTKHIHAYKHSLFNTNSHIRFAFFF